MQATIIYMSTRLFAGVHGAAKQQAAGSRGAPILVGSQESVELVCEVPLRTRRSQPKGGNMLTCYIDFVGRGGWYVGLWEAECSFGEDDVAADGVMGHYCMLPLHKINRPQGNREGTFNSNLDASEIAGLASMPVGGGAYGYAEDYHSDSDDANTEGTVLRFIVCEEVMNYLGSRQGESAQIQTAVSSYI